MFSLHQEDKDSMLRNNGCNNGIFHEIFHNHKTRTHELYVVGLETFHISSKTWRQFCWKLETLARNNHSGLKSHDKAHESTSLIRQEIPSGGNCLKKACCVGFTARAYQDESVEDCDISRLLPTVHQYTVHWLILIDLHFPTWLSCQATSSLKLKQ